jgi:hypothetical protein
MFVAQLDKIQRGSYTPQFHHTFGTMSLGLAFQNNF